jgi:hypothetical protein
VGLFLGDASFWEVLDQDFRLDFEFSSQFIDSDLIGICHSPLVLTATSYLSTAAYRVPHNPPNFFLRLFRAFYRFTDLFFSQCFCGFSCSFVE